MSRVRENRMHGSTGGSWKRSDWSGSSKWDNPPGNRGHKGFGTYHQTVTTAPAPDPTCQVRGGGLTVGEDHLWASFLLPGRSLTPGVARGGRRVPLPGCGFAAGRRGVWPGQAGSGWALRRASPVVMRCAKGAFLERLSQVRRERRALRPAMENNRRRSRLGSQTRASVPAKAEHLHPRGEFGGEHDDRDPDLVLREVM